MSEAYEIGVTLALSDGVSDGIERARRDMAQLQQVLTTGGVSVQQLRATAAGAVAPALQVAADRKVDAKRAEPGDVDQVPSAGTQQLAALPVPEKSVTFEGNAPDGDGLSALCVYPVRGPVRMEGGVTRTPPAPAAATPADGVWMVPQAAYPAAAPERIRTVEVPPPLPVAPMQEQAFVRAPLLTPDWERDAQVAWPVGFLQDDGAQPDADCPAGLLSAQVKRGAASPVRQFRDVTPRSPAFDSPAAVFTSPDAGAGFPDGLERVTTPDRQDSAAPGLSAAARPERTLRQGSVPEEPRETRAPQGGMEGDVYLDGMLVGRWMSRFLAREAGRASVGPTGFDGRRNRLLPGPTVGG